MTPIVQRSILPIFKYRRKVYILLFLGRIALLTGLSAAFRQTDTTSTILLPKPVFHRWSTGRNSLHRQVLRTPTNNPPGPSPEIVGDFCKCELNHWVGVSNKWKLLFSENEETFCVFVNDGSTCHARPDPATTPILPLQLVDFLGKVQLLLILILLPPISTLLLMLKSMTVVRVSMR